jgi:hypothetical protein
MIAADLRPTWGGKVPLRCTAKGGEKSCIQLLFLLRMKF